MKLIFDPSVIEPRHVTAESLALAAWYDAHPAIRRLWGVRDAQGLRVIVSIEPTLDDSDIYPVWLANTQAWADELRLSTGAFVELELIDELSSDGIDCDVECVVVADLFWRDPTLIPPRTRV